MVPVVGVKTVGARLPDGLEQAHRTGGFTTSRSEWHWFSGAAQHHPFVST